MGGTPHTALAIIGFAPCDYEPDIISEILKGAVHVLDMAGVSLIGGHSFEDPEIRFGLAVTGTINRDKILRKSGAKPGDAIILTKPLGIGILSTALKGNKLKDADMDIPIKWMLTLNNKASEAALEANATSATDVTGFGLLGHANNMTDGTDVDFIIENNKVPVLEMARELVASGMAPEGAFNNLNFLEGKIDYDKKITEEDKLLLSDPQTSGGLLITLNEKGLNSFTKSGVSFTVIGKVEKGKGRIKVI